MGQGSHYMALCCHICRDLGSELNDVDVCCTSSERSIYLWKSIALTPRSPPSIERTLGTAAGLAPLQRIRDGQKGVFAAVELPLPASLSRAAGACCYIVQPSFIYFSQSLFNCRTGTAGPVHCHSNPRCQWGGLGLAPGFPCSVPHSGDSTICT